MSDWQAESLRCTVFPAEQGVELPGFAVAIGTEPDRVEGQPKLRVQKESGVLADGATTVVLEQLPSLAHLRVGLPPEVSLKTGAEPAALEQANEIFAVYANRWLAALPPLSRLAFGAVLTRSVSSRAEGYQALNELLPAVDVDADGSEDFRYQVNRPREVVVGQESVRVNRLTKWSVRRTQVFAGDAASPATPRSLEDDYHVVLELDVNTAPGSTAILNTAATATKVFASLVELGVEISEKGDVK